MGEVGRVEQSGDETLGDEDLLRDVRAGRTGAYSQLYRRHQKEAEAAARRWGADQEAMDVVQEAFLKIFRAIQQGEGPTGRFLPYLLRTVRNESVDRSRRSARAEPMEHASLEDAGSVVEDGVEAQLDHDLLASAFASLPSRWREVLWLTEVEGAAPRILTSHFDLGPNAVAQLARRAREGLRAAWVKVNEEPSVPAECRDAQRGLASPRSTTRHQAASEHAAWCERCGPMAIALDRLSEEPRALLLPAILGSAPLLDAMRGLVGTSAVEGTVAASGTSAGQGPGAVPSDPGSSTSWAGGGASTSAGSGAATTVAGAGITGGWMVATAVSAVVLGAVLLVTHVVLSSDPSDPPEARAATISTGAASIGDASDTRAAPSNGASGAGASTSTRGHPQDTSTGEQPRGSSGGAGAAPDLHRDVPSAETRAAPVEAGASAPGARTSPPAASAASSGTDRTAPSTHEPSHAVSAGPAEPTESTTGPAEGAEDTAPKEPADSSTGATGADSTGAASPRDERPTAPPAASSSGARTPTGESTQSAPAAVPSPTVEPPTGTPVGPSTASATASRVEPPIIDTTDPTTSVLVRAHLTGRGQPGADVELLDRTGREVAHGRVGSDGRWSLTPEPAPAGAMTSYTAVQVVDGIRSGRSASTGDFRYETPEISRPTDGEQIFADDPGSGRRHDHERRRHVLLEMTMEPDAPYSVIIDGTERRCEGRADGLYRRWIRLAPGKHTIGVAYRDPESGDLGAVRSISVDVR